MTHDPAKPRSLVFALAPGTLLAGIAGGIVFPIFPAVGAEVGLSTAFVGMILAANRFTRVLCAPAVGIMTDRIGPRRTLLTGLCIQLVVISLFVAGLVTHHEGGAFLLGRLLHGLGSACVFVAASSLALQASTGTGGGAAAAAVRATIVIGVPIGLVVGGLLSEAVGNVATFVIAGGAVCVAFAAAYFAVPDQATSLRRPTFIAALGELRDRRVLAIGALNFALNFAAGGMVLSTLGFLVSSRHLSLLGHDDRGTSGLLMAILAVTDTAFTVFAGRLGDRYRAHGTVAAASLAIVAAGLVVIGLAGGELGTAIGIAIVGLGAAGLGPSVLVLLGVTVPADRRGTASGLLQLFGDTGAMLGPLVGSAIFAESTALPYLFTAGLMLCFVPIAIWLALVERRAQ